MSLSPRKHETQAVVELLEQEWESPEALARAILPLAYQLFQAREQYVVAVPNGYGQSAIYGPHAGAADAARDVKAAIFDDARVIPVYPRSMLLPEMRPDDPACACGHPKGSHEHLKGRGWCWAQGGSLKRGNECGCKTYEEAA